MRNTFTGLWVVTCGFALAGAAALRADTSLDVKASGLKTFYVDDRAGRNQVSIESESTLEAFTVVCNQVQGECKVDPKAVEKLSGKFAIKVADMRTGIDLRDTHLRSTDWLDAAKYPEIVIAVEKAEEVKKKEGNSATVTLVGTCSVHGKTNPIRIPATFTYLDENPTTMKIVKGDLVRFRAEFPLKLSDYAITGPAGSDTIGLKVSETLNVKVTVFGATEPPAAPLKADKDAGGTPKPKPPQEPGKP